MRSTVETILKKFDCLNKTLVVGFSGGYDSLCLLDVVAQLSKEYGFEAVAAHLNHNWRAAEAKAEQRRCEDIAQKLGVKFITQTLEPDAKMTENDGRIARYEFFENCAKRFNDASGLYRDT